MPGFSFVKSIAKENKLLSARVAIRWQLIIFLASLIAASPARSAIVYSQASDPPDNAKIINSSATNPDGSDQDVTTFDNFKLAKPARITGVTWRGSSTDSSTVGFNITIFGTQANTASQTDLTNAVAVINETGKANEKPVGKNLSDYSAEFSQPVELSAGTPYWISIVSVRNFPSPWGWSSGTGGDGGSIQSYTELRNLRAPNDRAFSLVDESTESPK